MRHKLAQSKRSSSKLMFFCNLSATHNMDSHQDVLREICYHIGVSLTLPDEDPSSAIARRSLMNVALAGRASYEPAISVLWRVLPSLIPLLKLFPSFQLVNNQTYVLADVRRDSEEWEKFDYHARHVQILRLSQTRLPVSPFVYDRLRQLRKDPLLPALRELRIPARYVGDLRSSFMSLSPQLRLVELHSNSVEFFLSFIPTLVEEAPLLTHLILHTQVDVDLDRVSDLNQLCKLDLQVPTWNLSKDFIRKLGELERLLDLRVELNNELDNCRRNKKPTCHLLGNSLTNDGYQKLQTLLIRGSAIAIKRMMRAMSFASLSTLTLEFSTTDSWQGVFKTLVEKETHVTTVSLHSYSVKIECKFGWISPLLQIPTLETLEINTKSFSIDDDEFFSLMASLPNLKTLSLPPSSRSTSLTAQVLWQPSKLAPVLAELKIPFFQSPAPPSGMMEIKISRRHAHLALRKLSISSPYGDMQDGDVIHFARLLYRAFPNLEIVEGFGPNSHFESWGRVDAFRNALVMCSREDD